MKTKEIGIWIGLIVVLIGGLWLLVTAVNTSPSFSTSSAIKIPEVSKNDFIRTAKSASGSARLPASERSDGGQAKVTLVEYADFQCPACGSFYFLIKRLEEDFKNDLRVVFRLFPLIDTHQNSMISSQAAYAASLQGKFWKMHDMLYENQDSWSNSTQAKDIFTGYAKKLSLDLNKFKSDMNNSSTKKFITNEENKAITLGINSTPTFFVNEGLIQNPTGYEGFKKIIQDEIDKK